jgi:hypothetical protein
VQTRSLRFKALLLAGEYRPNAHLRRKTVQILGRVARIPKLRLRLKRGGTTVFRQFLELGAVLLLVRHRPALATLFVVDLKGVHRTTPEGIQPCGLIGVLRLGSVPVFGTVIHGPGQSPS